MGEINLKFEIDSYGKINLALDVLHKREDGYHEIRSIMQQISLSDSLEFKEQHTGVSIQCDNGNVPLNEDNLIYKAWDKMSKIVGTKAGISVRINKNIPVAAGLAGGSGNGSATLLALNHIWGLKLELRELMEIGRTIGADIPFCLLGGTALAEGIGEKLTPIEPFNNKSILLINPGIEISSGYVYSLLRLKEERLPIDDLINHIKADDIIKVGATLGNVMEDAILPKYPVIDEIKSRMVELGSLGSLMSGSGSSVFGIFEDPDRCEFAKNKLIGDYPYVFNVMTI